MIITGNVNTNKIYSCKIRRSGCMGGEFRAYVLFTTDENHVPQAWLLSNAVNPDGREISYNEWPLKAINVDTHTILVEKEASCQGRLYDNLSDLMEGLGVKKHVVLEYGKYRVFDCLAPPKGEETFFGTFYSPSGEKRVYKYSGSSRMKVVDITTGSSVDIEHSDLSAYLT